MSHAAWQVQQKIMGTRLNKKQWLFLLITWLFSQMIFLYVNGITILGESDFIQAANQISSGNFNIELNNYFYSGNIITILFFKVAGIAYNWIYLVQLLVAAMAFVCFIKFLQRNLSRAVSIIIAALLFATCPFFQPWTSFLSTDSIFANLIIITLYYLINSSLKHKIWLMIALILLPFFRPVGFLFLPVAIFYWASHQPKKNINRIILFSGYFILLCFFSWYCLTHSNYFFYPQHNSEANIICGYPSDLTKYIKEPYDVSKSMFHFFVANPEMTWRLVLHRFLKSFWMTRPYYSAKHNFFIVLCLTPYYILSITGAISFFRKKIFFKNAYLILGLLLFVLPNLLFCADWVNRFMLPALVFLFILIAFGIDFLVSKFGKSEDPGIR